METKTLEPILKEHEFFKDLAPDYLMLLVECAKNVRFHQGEYLMREGEEANEFFLLRHGEVGIEITMPAQGPRTIQTLSEGEVVGWSWLFPPYRAHYSVRCKTLVRALSLDGECIRGKCETNPRLGYELMQRFAQIMMDRLKATRMQLLDVYG